MMRAGLQGHRFATLALVCIAGLAGQVWAQEPEQTEIGQTYRVADAEYVRLKAVEFHRYAEQGEWELAAEKIQALLDLPLEAGLVVQEPGQSKGRYVGVARYARRLFAGLPAEGRAAWEKLSRKHAEALLARGITMRRQEDLAAAARRYPAPDVHRRAYDALARIATDRGDFSLAAHALERLLDTLPDGDRAEAFARLALVRSQSGDREATERVAALAQPLASTEVPGPGGPESLSRFMARMVEAAGPAQAAVTGWPQFSGNAHGTRLSDHLTQPGAPGWAEPAATLYQEGIETPSSRRRYEPRPTTVQPVVSGNSVYVNSGQVLRAVNLDTGQDTWVVRGPQATPIWRDNDAIVHSAAVAADRVYAALAVRSVAPDVTRQFMRYLIIYAMPQRVLYALHRATGEVIWDHTEASVVGRPDADEMLEECVCSPPLVVGDDLLVATWVYESEYEVRLVCFDRHTGATRWRRALAGGQQELNLFGRPVKELASSSLAELDGVVYLGTGVGVAAAVDRSSGEILWLTAYQRVPIPPSRAWYMTEDRSIAWRPTPVVATRKAVLMAPPDATRLMAFDPTDGRRLWGQPSQDGRDAFRWFVGVANGRAFVAGDRLAALDLEDGREVWNTEQAGRLALPHHRSLSAYGRPVLTEDRVYVPTRETILVMNARTGIAEDEWPLHDPARGDRWGDLLGADGTLLVTRHNSVQAYYQFEDLQQRLLARISRAPDDPRLRLEAGEIFRTAGRLDDSISSLEHGLALLEKLTPRARERLESPMRRSLHEAYRARARQRLSGGGLEGALTDLGLAVETAGEPEDAAGGLLDLAAAAARFGRHRTADEALQRLLREHPAVTVRLDAQVTAHSGALALFRLGELDEATGKYAQAAGRWLDLLERHPDADLGPTNVQAAVRSRLTALRNEHPAETGELIAKRSQQALIAARTAGDPYALSRVARLYPDPDVAAQAALLAADIHAQRHRHRDAMLTLREMLLQDLDDRTKARALWRLARAYKEMRAIFQERAALERLLREVPDIRLTNQTAGELAQTELQSPRFSKPALSLPDPQPPLTPLWESGQGEAVAPDLIRMHGAMPQALEGHFLATRGRTLEFLDGETGQVRWRKTLRADPHHAVGTANQVVLVGDHARGRRQTVTITAFEAANGEVPWERTLEGAFKSAASSLGAVYVLTSSTGSDGRPRFSMTSVDLATGEVLATRAFEGIVGRRFEAAEDVLLVYESARSGRGGEPRTVTVLDAQTLSVRGRVPLVDSQDRWPAIHAPETPTAVIVDENDAVLVGIDLVSGKEAWRRPLDEGRSVSIRSLHPLSGALAVAGTDDSIRRIDIQTGEAVWTRPLGGAGRLTYGGVMAADGVIVANVKGRDNRLPEIATVCLDARNGRELWRTQLGRVQHAHATICASVVAYKLKIYDEHGHAHNFVTLLDRRSGKEVQRLEPESLLKSYQTLFFAGTRLVIAAPAGIVCFGRRDG